MELQPTPTPRCVGSGVLKVNAAFQPSFDSASTLRMLCGMLLEKTARRHFAALIKDAAVKRKEARLYVSPPLVVHLSRDGEGASIGDSRVWC